MKNKFIVFTRFVTTAEETGSIVNVYQSATTASPQTFCFGLEDQAQKVKVPGETRIPPGTYPVTIRKEGGMHARYTAKFPFHQGMLWLRKVPGFEWIYIHVGNTDDHTSGCLLVGESIRMSAKGRLTLGHSVAAYTRLYKSVLEQAKAGKLYVKVGDVTG